MTERIGVIRQDGVVINAIIWGDETAEQLLADGITDFEEVTNINPMPAIRWLWDEVHGYRPPSPFPSWVWNGVTWTAPTPKPEGDYLWNEETQTWDAIPAPTE